MQNVMQIACGVSFCVFGEEDKAISFPGDECPRAGDKNIAKVGRWGWAFSQTSDNFHLLFRGRCMGGIPGVKYASQLHDNT